MKTVHHVPTIHFLLTLIIFHELVQYSLSMSMWTSLEKRQASGQTPVKRCVSPCKIFHTWCKNDGKCREKGVDCTWYCECPENCEGFFCEKIVADNANSGGGAVEYKATYEKETKKPVSAFDKSKLAQALAGIYLKKQQTDAEMKNSKTNCPPEELTGKSTTSHVKSTTATTTLKTESTLTTGYLTMSSTKVTSDGNRTKENLNVTSVTPPNNELLNTTSSTTSISVINHTVTPIVSSSTFAETTKRDESAHQTSQQIEPVPNLQDQIKVSTLTKIESTTTSFEVSSTSESTTKTEDERNLYPPSVKSENNFNSSTVKEVKANETTNLLEVIEKAIETEQIGRTISTTKTDQSPEITTVRINTKVKTNVKNENISDTEQNNTSMENNDYHLLETVQDAAGLQGIKAVDGTAALNKSSIVQGNSSEMMPENNSSNVSETETQQSQSENEIGVEKIKTDVQKLTKSNIKQKEVTDEPKPIKAKHIENEQAIKITTLTEPTSSSTTKTDAATTTTKSPTTVSTNLEHKLSISVKQENKTENTMMTTSKLTTIQTTKADSKLEETTSVSPKRSTSLTKTRTADVSANSNDSLSVTTTMMSVTDTQNQTDTDALTNGSRNTDTNSGTTEKTGQQTKTMSSATTKTDNLRNIKSNDASTTDKRNNSPEESHTTTTIRASTISTINRNGLESSPSPIHAAINNKAALDQTTLNAILSTENVNKMHGKNKVTSDTNMLSTTSLPSLNVTGVIIRSHDVSSTAIIYSSTIKTASSINEHSNSDMAALSKIVPSKTEKDSPRQDILKDHSSRQNISSTVSSTSSTVSASSVPDKNKQNVIKNSKVHLPTTKHPSTTLKIREKLTSQEESNTVLKANKTKEEKSGTSAPTTTPSESGINIIVPTDVVETITSQQIIANMSNEINNTAEVTENTTKDAATAATVNQGSGTSGEQTTKQTTQITSHSETTQSTKSVESPASERTIKNLTGTTTENLISTTTKELIKTGELDVVIDKVESGKDIFLDIKSDIKHDILANQLTDSVKKDLKYDLLKMDLHEHGLPSDLDNKL